MTADETLNKLNSSAKWDVGVPIYRTNPLPLDYFSLFGSEAEAEEYLSNPVCYPGQIIAVISDGSTALYKIVSDASGAYSIEMVGGLQEQSITVTDDELSTLYGTGTLTLTAAISLVDVINLALGTSGSTISMFRASPSSWGVFLQGDEQLISYGLTSSGVLTYETYDRIEPNPSDIPSESTIHDLTGIRIGEDYYSITDETARSSAKEALEVANSKQSALTFDDTPKQGSGNPVTSDGIHGAIEGVLTFDDITI